MDEAGVDAGAADAAAVADADAGSIRCDTTKPFPPLDPAKQQAFAFATLGIAGPPHLTTDELTIVLGANPPSAPHMQIATRPNRTDLFGTPKDVEGTNADDQFPAITADGLTIYFSSPSRAPANMFDIFVATLLLAPDWGRHHQGHLRCPTRERGGDVRYADDCG